MLPSFELASQICGVVTTSGYRQSRDIDSTLVPSILQHLPLQDHTASVPPQLHVDKGMIMTWALSKQAWRFNEGEIWVMLSIFCHTREALAEV